MTIEEVFSTLDHVNVLSCYKDEVFRFIYSPLRVDYSFCFLSEFKDFIFDFFGKEISELILNADYRDGHISIDFHGVIYKFLFYIDCE